MKVKIKVTPYPYQKEGARFILKNKFVIIADECGLGKTLQALLAISATNEKALIVCPSYLKRNWESEVNKFVPHLTCKAYYKASEMKPTNHDIVIMSYSQLKYAFKVRANRKFLCYDECHFIKGHTAKRTELSHELVNEMRPNYMVGLSGTPIKNNVTEFYTVVGLCSYREKRWPKDILEDFTYWEFCSEFSHKREFNIRNPKTKRAVKVTKFTGVKNIPLLKEYLAGKYLRRTADKVLDLPLLVEKDVMVKYKTTADAGLLQLWKEHETGVKGHVSSVKREAALVKADFTIEYIRNLYEETGSPLLVFTDHPSVCLRIVNAISNIKAEFIDGSVGSDTRFQIVERFQRGGLDLLVATIGAASTGFNITRTNHVIFNDLTWTPTDNYQALCRAYRIGQTKTTFIHYILGSKVDRMIAKNLREKELTLRKAL